MLPELRNRMCFPPAVPLKRSVPLLVRGFHVRKSLSLFSTESRRFIWQLSLFVFGEVLHQRWRR